MVDLGLISLIFLLILLNVVHPQSGLLRSSSLPCFSLGKTSLFGKTCCLHMFVWFGIGTNLLLTRGTNNENIINFGTVSPWWGHGCTPSFSGSAMPESMTSPRARTLSSCGSFHAELPHCSLTADTKWQVATLIATTIFIDGLTVGWLGGISDLGYVDESKLIHSLNWMISSRKSN